MGLRIEAYHLPDRTVVLAVGEVDVATRLALLNALKEGPAPWAILIASRIGFIDASGLSALISADRALRDKNGGLTVVAPSRPMTRLLDLTGLRARFTTFVNLNSALSAWS